MQNDNYFAADILKWIFFNENVWISIVISVKFVFSGSKGNNPIWVR